MITCAECGTLYKGLKGIGLHNRSKHLELYHQENQVPVRKRCGRKRRKTGLYVKRHHSSLTASLLERLMRNCIFSIHTGARRKQEHKKTIEQELIRIQAQSEDVMFQEPMNNEWSHEFLENIRFHLRGLETMDNKISTHP